MLQHLGQLMLQQARGPGCDTVAIIERCGAGHARLGDATATRLLA